MVEALEPLSAGHALMDGAWCGLPGQAASVPVELQLVGEVLGLLVNSDELHDGKELLVAAALLLLLQHQHEVEAEAGLHHHPVHCPRQVDVRGQEHNVSWLNGAVRYFRI